MAAGKYDFTVEQGATFRRTLVWKDAQQNLVNLSGYTAALNVRTSHDSTTSFLSLTTANGGITLGGALGTISLYISATDTNVITQKAGVYTLELTNGSDVTRLLQGKLKVSVR